MALLLNPELHPGKYWSCLVVPACLSLLPLSNSSGSLTLTQEELPGGLGSQTTSRCGSYPGITDASKALCHLKRVICDLACAVLVPLKASLIMNLLYCEPGVEQERLELAEAEHQGLILKLFRGKILQGRIQMKRDQKADSAHWTANCRV